MIESVKALAEQAVIQATVAAEQMDEQAGYNNPTTRLQFSVASSLAAIAGVMVEAMAEHQAERAEAMAAPTPHQIIVNGRQFDADGGHAFFDEVVDLAGFAKGEQPTITYTHAAGDADDRGTLLPGQSVRVKDGTVFDVLHPKQDTKGT